MKKLVTVKELDRAVGCLSDTSKMPGKSWSTSPWLCHVGAKLSKVPGSVCESCYAKKGRYSFVEPQEAQARRLSKLRKIREWTEDMVELLQRGRWNNWQWFRWFDSGDLRGPRQLKAILEIARRVPEVKFWLPTKEYELVTKHATEIGQCQNLVVRVSSPLIGQGPMRVPLPLKTSTVDSGQGHLCPASRQGGSCGDCRACWSPDVPNVDYPKH